MSKWRRLNNDPDDDVEKRDERPLKLFAICCFCEASGNEPVVVFTDEKGFMGKASNPVVRSSDSVPSENIPSVRSDPKVLSEADIDFLEEMDGDMLLEAVNNAEILLKPPASQELQNRCITPEQDAQKQTDDSLDDAPMDGYVDDKDDDDDNSFDHGISHVGKVLHILLALVNQRSAAAASLIAEYARFGEFVTDLFFKERGKSGLKNPVTMASSYKEVIGFRECPTYEIGVAEYA
ncbi:unnamed protein product, partial [Notodromas monacha]